MIRRRLKRLEVVLAIFVVILIVGSTISSQVFSSLTTTCQVSAQELLDALLAQGGGEEEGGGVGVCVEESVYFFQEENEDECDVALDPVESSIHSLLTTTEFVDLLQETTIVSTIVQEQQQQQQRNDDGDVNTVQTETIDSSRLQISRTLNETCRPSQREKKKNSQRGDLFSRKRIMKFNWRKSVRFWKIPKRVRKLWQTEHSNTQEGERTHQATFKWRRFRVSPLKRQNKNRNRNNENRKGNIGTTARNRKWRWFRVSSINNRTKNKRSCMDNISNKRDGMSLEGCKLTWSQKWQMQLHSIVTNNGKNNNNTDNSKNDSDSAASSKRRQFLDRIAVMTTTFLSSEGDASPQQDEEEKQHHDDDDLDEITHQSDMTLPNRRISVVTTAALPWMTGTAVNPLLRAAYLCRKTREINIKHQRQKYLQQHQQQEESNTLDDTGAALETGIVENNVTVEDEVRYIEDTEQRVSLVIPWLELEEDRLELYGEKHMFANQSEQEAYIRKWMREEAGLVEEADPNTGLKLIFYNARYHFGLKSIFAMGDICSLIPNSEADVCILEEPEHLNWYRAPGDGWKNKFKYVVGIVHTNYREYAASHYSGLWTAPAIAVMSSAMVRAYCHKVIKLSDVLQTFAPEKEVVSNVHGVRSDFLKEGERRGRETLLQKEAQVEVCAPEANSTNNGAVVYFIGKLLWAKGLDRLLELQSFYRQCTGDYFPIDIYGSGPEQVEIKRAYHGRNPNGRKKKSKSKSQNRNNAKKAILVSDSSGSASTENTSSDEPPAEDDRDAMASLDFSAVTIQALTKNLKETIKATTESLASVDLNSVNIQTLTKNLRETIKATTDTLDFDPPKTLSEWRRQPIPATFPGRVDHALLTQNYKIFVNPSVTEVLCTTTAEALAMGKFVIIPIHPSNEFFLRFPNCLGYRNKWEFAANLRWALAHEPEPLTPELSHEFTWEAATERFIEASAITLREARERERLGTSQLDERIAWFHNEIGKGARGDTLRKVLGGGPASGQVKYIVEQNGGRAEEEEEDDVGLTDKFRRSTLAQAIKSTLANGFPLSGAWSAT